MKKVSDELKYKHYLLKVSAEKLQEQLNSLTNKIKSMEEKYKIYLVDDEEKN